MQHATSSDINKFVNNTINIDQGEKWTILFSVNNQTLLYTVLVIAWILYLYCVNSIELNERCQQVTCSWTKSTKHGDRQNMYFSYSLGVTGHQ